jgi:RNA polymerase sigma-70 factor, ECF subfamily
MMALRGLRLGSRTRQLERALPARQPLDDGWLVRFHAGEPSVIATCYREHFATVERAIGSILSGADRETAIHEVFARVIASEHLRRSFQGGSLPAWLATVGRNQAIDVRRRLSREVHVASAAAPEEPPEWEPAAEARLLVERFRREHLPPEWAGVFEARFLDQLPQREAAARLSMHRTTLAYRELRIRRLLRRFLLDDDMTTTTTTDKRGTP